jgi:hypothetical protein
MKMAKNYNKELDYILEELIHEYENHYKGLTFYTEEVSFSTKEKISTDLADRYNLEEWEINILYYTLLIDTYIKTIDPLTISLSGLVFRNNGGYTEQQIKKEKEKNKIEKIENDFKKYQFLLMVFTAFVALGTLISAWFFGIEIWKYYQETL